MLRNIFGFAICILGCNYNSVVSRPATNKNLRCIQVSQFFPKINDKGRLEGYDTFYAEIYYSDNLVLNKLSYISDSLTTGGVHKIETKYHYLVYQTGSKFGIDYNAQTASVGKKVSVDSTHQYEWAFNTYMDHLFQLPGITLVKIEKNNDTLHESYIFRATDDTTKSGRIDLFFNNELKDIDYSLAKGLDSIRNKKLYKSKVINNTRYMKEQKIQLDAFESNVYALEEIPVKNEDEIMAYFTRYKKDSGK